MNCLGHLILVLISVTVSFAASAYAWKTTNVSESPHMRVVGGHEAEPYSRPYIVSLQQRIVLARQHICGGTLLTEYLVLTAAHCVVLPWPINLIPIDVVAGVHDILKIGHHSQFSTVEKLIPHPSYKREKYNHDIALVKVTSPFVFSKEVLPINLPVNEEIGMGTLSVAGWGQVLGTTTFFPAVPNKLQEVTVTYLPNDECNKALLKFRDEGDIVLVSDYDVCTGPLNAGIAPCIGDSGGPLIQECPGNNIQESNSDETTDTDSKEYDYYGVNAVIVGVISRAVQPCGRKGGPSIYTKVSCYLDFINQYIKKYEKKT